MNIFDTILASYRMLQIFTLFLYPRSLKASC